MPYTLDSNTLKRWFQEEKRDLPWRRTTSPYAIWVSEVMLQQTRAEVVIPYYSRWMQRFPTLADLAQASLQEVMKLWEGLGYYSRARNLYQGAQYVLQHHQGVLPEDSNALAKIKGLGPYTIGAILSFAFHQKAPAVDGNVLRVLARYFNIHDDLSKPKTVQSIRKLAEEILPNDEPWIVAEALIELGATICKRTPLCVKCPLQRSCQGYAQGCEQQLPVKTSKTHSEALFRCVAIIRAGNRFLIRLTPNGEVMSGLYEFPYFEATKEGLAKEELYRLIQTSFQVNVEDMHSLPTVKHTFTRFQATLFPFLCQCPEAVEDAPSGYKWVSKPEAEQLPFSSGHRRILNLIHP